MATNTEINGVLVIYTGGTIGSFPKDGKDPNSPLTPLSKEQLEKKDNEFFKMIPRYNQSESKIAIGRTPVTVKWRSLDVPIDSSNVSPDVWTEIATIIKEEYKNYEGFVILHGTDTMVYTACILSFMLEDLNRPVIITGSQKPIGETRSDAVQNLITSIEIAAAKTLGQRIVPEVCIFFRNKLMRGCRIIKYSASKYEAFVSPNLFELGTADEHIVIDDKLAKKPLPIDDEKNLVLQTAYHPRVMYFTVAPGMDIKLLETILTSKDLDGVILLTYGTGNAPTLPEFIKVINKAINDEENPKIIVNISQCLSGEVEQGLYDVSVGLMSSGVVSGLDMTREAAYTKLCWLLGTEKDKSKSAIADRMQINLRGELRQSIFNYHFGPGFIDKNKFSKTVEVKNMEGKEYFDSEKIDKAFLRILGVRFEGRAKIDGKAYIGLDDANDSTPEDIDNFIGKFEKGKFWNLDDDPESIIIPMTTQARKFINGIKPVKLTIVDNTGLSMKWEKLEIGIYTNN